MVERFKNEFRRIAVTVLIRVTCKIFFIMAKCTDGRFLFVHMIELATINLTVLDGCTWHRLDGTLLSIWSGNNLLRKGE